MWDGISIIDDMTEEMWMDVHGMFNYMMEYSRFLVIGKVWWTIREIWKVKGLGSEKCHTYMVGYERWLDWSVGYMK